MTMSLCTVNNTHALHINTKVIPNIYRMLTLLIDLENLCVLIS